MAPLRIAFIGQKGIPARWGGVEQHVDAIATRLATRGHDVSVYVRRWYSPGRPRSYRGVRLIPRPTLRTKHADASLHSLLSSLDAVVRSYDIVHYHAIGPALFSFLPRIAGRRVVATIHALDYRRSKWGALARAALRLGERCACGVAHRTIVVSRHLADHYEGRGVPTEYLPNGQDLLAPMPPQEIRSRLGLEGEDYLLSLGRWTPAKRVLELLEAFAALQRQDLRLVVAGGVSGLPAYAEAVRRAARTCPGVVLPGYVEGRLKQELLSNARAFVTFSRLEGMPLALLEAMSLGRACLASDIPPHRELLGAAAGLLRPAETSAQRVAALQELLSLSAAERVSLGQAARRHVAAAHDWEPIVDRLEALYQELV
ncbi:MAG: glycosyltransferase family 4 protein [Planctomycetota bacterium]|jgi:glycosyltransferase involved in cell wall biosynthesis